MQKKIIALAVAGLVSGAAFAQSNVTVYGQANMSYDQISTGAAGADTLNRISSNSSRLGFKGTEALGGGLSANFQMETGINMDSNVANAPAASAVGGNYKDFMNRNTFVGLKSDKLGEVRFGRHDTPYKLGSGSLDVFADTMGDHTSIIGSVNGTNYFDSRLGNVAAYISPTWSGFHFAVATITAQEDSNGATANGKAYSAVGVYVNGPLFASLAFEKAADTLDMAQAAAAANNSSVPVVGTGNDAKATKLGLGYTVNALKLGFIWEKISASSGLSQTLSRSAYALSAAYTMGSTTLKAAYNKANDGADAATDNAAKQVSLGVEHALSKRTAVYALYTRMDNSLNATYNIGEGQGGKYKGAAGEDPRAISLGIKHNF